MKLLRKLLGLLPLLGIGLVLLLAFITFCLGFGKVVSFSYTDCLSGGSCYHTTSEVIAYSPEWFVDESLPTGNFFSILAFLLFVASLVFSILNMSNKAAKGPWLLLAGIFTFAAQFFFMARPIILIDIRTTDIGDVWETFNWVTFGFSTLPWFNCIALFVLNKTLFKKVIAEA